MSESAWDVLRRIAEGTEPCRECGLAHGFHPWTEVRDGVYAPSRKAGTWAAPDGHPYRRMTPQEYARSVIGE